MMPLASDSHSFRILLLPLFGQPSYLSSVQITSNLEPSQLPTLGLAMIHIASLSWHAR